jgi:5'-deoxynucleotidase YfbR-like HD superfamily hydrolase
MTILTVYQNYQIMPALQEHMLRVAGVGLLICESLKVPVNTRDVVAACLLHDMGNLLKFDLNVFPEFLEPQGKAYWQKIKEEYQHKYGPNEHDASIQIAKEVGASETVTELITAIDFLLAAHNLESENMERKICAYADMRVAPEGVKLLRERLADLEKRYGKKYPHPDDVQKRKEYAACLAEMEQHIFALSSLSPNDITENSVQVKVEELRNWTI